MIKGVISDMDGVMLDSEKLYVRFWCEAARSFGYPMEKKHALGIRSLSRVFAIEKLQGWFGKEFDYDAVRNKRIELMDNYVAENGIEAKSGAKELLVWLKQNGYKTALATATPVDRASLYLYQVGLLEYFDVICSAREVKRGKPEPDIYLLAAKRLGLAPEECLAIGHKALAVGALLNGGVGFVGSDADRLKRAVVLAVVVVFAACYVADNALVSVVVVCHYYHLANSVDSTEDFIHFFIL